MMRNTVRTRIKEEILCPDEDNVDVSLCKHESKLQVPYSRVVGQGWNAVVLTFICRCWQGSSGDLIGITEGLWSHVTVKVVTKVVDSTNGDS